MLSSLQLSKFMLLINENKPHIKILNKSVPEDRTLRNTGRDLLQWTIHVIHLCSLLSIRKVTLNLPRCWEIKPNFSNDRAIWEIIETFGYDGKEGRKTFPLAHRFFPCLNYRHKKYYALRPCLKPHWNFEKIFSK